MSDFNDIDHLLIRVAELEAENERWQVRAQYFRGVLRAVTAERDTLTARVAELEAERDRWKRQSDDWQRRGWELGNRVDELEAELRTASGRAHIWEAVSHELGVCYDPDEEEPGDTAVHDIRDLVDDADRLQRLLIALAAWKADVHRNPNAWQEGPASDYERAAYARAMRNAEMQVSNIVNRTAPRPVREVMTIAFDPVRYDSSGGYEISPAPRVGMGRVWDHGCWCILDWWECCECLRRVCPMQMFAGEDNEYCANGCCWTPCTRAGGCSPVRDWEDVSHDWCGFDEHPLTRLWRWPHPCGGE